MVRARLKDGTRRCGGIYFWLPVAGHSYKLGQTGMSSQAIKINSFLVSFCVLSACICIMELGFHVYYCIMKLN